jgi:drug/metabolite transporter (DMT)-like permease
LKAADLAELFALAALWGASFLLMRMGAGDFGPIALSAIRVAGATMLLLPIVGLRGQMGALRRHWRPIFVVGVTNTALPFLCFCYAALSITSGMSAIFNSASPLFAALIARLWLRNMLTRMRIAGLAIGFAGVLWTAWGGASFKPGGSGWAIFACLFATLCYGWSPNYTKLRLSGVPTLAVAGGSQLAAALFLAGPAWIWWPAGPLTGTAWLLAAVLAFACTGVAYLVYFRLITNIGPTNAIAVTFLIPAFAILWGWMFLDEGITPRMVAGCATIVAGTALATGLVKWPTRRPVAAG